MRYQEDYYEEVQEPHLGYRANPQEFGCEFCWDNRAKKNIEIYFFDRANNMRICQFCPSCGRNIE